MHTMNLGAGYIEGPLRAGMVIDFEPIVSIAGQGYYLEDMYLIGKTGAEVLTPHFDCDCFDQLRLLRHERF